MIYLDSAATSLLKPPEVSKAMLSALRECASPGRGAHAPAMRAADIVYSCREEAADFFGVPGPENVVHTMNATHGLNIAVHSLVRPGSRVLVSGYEHNAVVRPLYAVGANMQIAQAPLFDADALLEAFREGIGRADAVVCTHVSNVFGFRLPIESIAALCREKDVPLIVDAAQSAGQYDLDMSALGAAFIAMPGHKGLMGPQGTGLLLCRDGASPLLYGGTGSLSASPDMPEDLPDRLEAGTQNVCGIAGLRAALRCIQRTGLRSVRGREEALSGRLLQGLLSLPGLKVFVPPRAHRSGVISVLPLEMTCEELASRLGAAGVAVRAGLQCAPQAHMTAGTLDTGTVRFSVSPLNTPAEIEKALEITEEIIK